MQVHLGKGTRGVSERFAPSNFLEKAHEEALPERSSRYAQVGGKWGGFCATERSLSPQNPSSCDTATPAAVPAANPAAPPSGPPSTVPTTDPTIPTAEMRAALNHALSFRSTFGAIAARYALLTSFALEGSGWLHSHFRNSSVSRRWRILTTSSWGITPRR